MTAVQNVELSPVNGAPAKGVKVQIRIGGVPAATDSGTGSVVASTTVYSAADGSWSANLIPNSTLNPDGTWYEFIRTYKASQGGQKIKQWGVVPNQVAPVNFESIIVSEPTAPALTESELTLHLAHVNPHGQYLLASNYVPGGAAVDATATTKGIVQLAGDLQGTAALPTVKKSAITAVRLDEMATPTADVALGTRKITGQLAGTAATDGMNKGQLDAHVADAADPHAAANYSIMVGGGRRFFIQESDPAGDPNLRNGDAWLQPSSGQWRARVLNAWSNPSTTTGGTAPTTTTTASPTQPPPVVSTDRVTDVKAAVNQFFAEFVRADGAVLQKEADNKVVSEGAAYAMLFAVMAADQVKFDLARNWANNNLRRIKNTALTTGKYLWAWNYNATTNAVLDWNWATDADYDRAMALMRACQLWNRQQDYEDLNQLVNDLKQYTLNFDEGRAYQTTDEFQRGAGTGTAAGHHAVTGGFVWEMNISYMNPVVYRMLKAYTGDGVWDQALNGYYDILDKATNNAGGMAVTTGLVPDWCDYSTVTHDAGPLTTGTNGWAYTRSTGYAYDGFRTGYRAYHDILIYNEARAKTWIGGNFKTFMRNEWTTNTAIYDGYAHNGTRVSSNPKNVFAWPAHWAIKTANASDGVAATIKSSWLTNIKATNTFGTYFRNDPVAVPTSTYYGNSWMIFGEATDAGMFNALADISGITGKYVPPGTAPVVGGAVAPSGTWSLFTNPNTSIRGYTNGLPTGAKRTRFEWAASQPNVMWTGPDPWWDPNGTQATAYVNAAKAAGKDPTISMYGIPNRDLGGASAGGSAGAASYRTWATAVANGIGTTRCLVVLEPDSIALIIGKPDAEARYSLIAEVVGILRNTCPNIRLYLDAAHSAWYPDPTPLAGPLQRSGVGNTHGICANVSNFRPDSEVAPWCNNLLGKLNLPALGYIWDTSRNGKNPPPDGSDWQNPLQVRYGRTPQYGGTVLSNDPKAHGCLWVKPAGESDGNDPAGGQGPHGGPNAGAFWPEYLYVDGIADNANGPTNGNLIGSGNAGMLQRPPTPGVPF